MPDTFRGPQRQLRDAEPRIQENLSAVGGPHFPVEETGTGVKPTRRRRFDRRLPFGRVVVEGCAGVGTVLNWELHSFVRRPSGWLLLLAAVLMGGWSFSWLVALLVRGGGVSLRQVDDPIAGFLGPNLFLVSLGTLFVPLLTMNFVADERRRGTWELLLTTPTSHGQALLGKFLAGWGLLLATLSPWVYYLLVLRFWNGRTQFLWGFVPWFDGLGVDFDFGPVVTGTIGLAMIGGTFIAIGLFCSSLCRRPLSAALLTFGVLASVLVLSFLPRVLLTWGFAREQLVWLEAFSCWGHLERFSRGTILPRVMIGHLSLWGTLLWLATHVARRVDDA